MSKSKEVQIAHINKILELSAKHPDCEIKFIADNNGGDYGWTEQCITRVELSDYYLKNDDQILLDEDDIRDAISDTIEVIGGMTDIELNEQIDDIYKKEVSEIIAVYTN